LFKDLNVYECCRNKQEKVFFVKDNFPGLLSDGKTFYFVNKSDSCFQVPFFLCSGFYKNIFTGTEATLKRQETKELAELQKQVMAVAVKHLTVR